MESTASAENNTQEGSKSIPADDFIAGLKNPTEGDAAKAPDPVTTGQPATSQPVPDPEAAFIAKLLVNTTTVFVNGACQVISGEKQEELFVISEASKDSIRKPLADLMEYYKMKFNPWWVLILAVCAAYAPPVMKASSIAWKKNAQKKVAIAKGKGDSVMPPIKVETKKGPGRPVGSTKKS